LSELIPLVLYGFVHVAVLTDLN